MQNIPEWKIKKIFDIMRLYTEDTVQTTHKKMLLDIYLQKDVTEKKKRIKETTTEVINEIRNLENEYIFIDIFTFINIWDSDNSYENKFIQSLSSVTWFRSSLYYYMEIFSKFRYFENSKVKFERRDRLEVENNKIKIRELPRFIAIVKIFGFIRALDYLYNLLDGLNDEKDTGIVLKNFPSYEENETFLMVQYCFNSRDDKKWNKYFLKRSDFDTFCNILTNFLHDDSYEIPDVSFTVKPGGQTKAAKALREIQSNAGRGKLIRDIKYFNIVRLLGYFGALSNDEIYEKLT